MYPIIKAAAHMSKLWDTATVITGWVWVRESNIRKKTITDDLLTSKSCVLFKKSDQVPAGSLYQVSQSESVVCCKQTLTNNLKSLHSKCTDLRFQVWLLPWKSKYHHKLPTNKEQEGLLLNKTHSTIFSYTFCATHETPCVPLTVNKSFTFKKWTFLVH